MRSGGCQRARRPHNDSAKKTDTSGAGILTGDFAATRARAAISADDGDIDLNLRAAVSSRRLLRQASMTDHRSPRVLVVDDEKHLRRMLCDLLALWGCQSDAAGGAREGLQLFVQGGYDLVMTDLVMPGDSGLELIESIRHRDPSVGVIMFTASAADLEGQGRRLGFTLVRKPIHITGLEMAVREALASRTPAEELGR